MDLVHFSDICRIAGAWPGEWLAVGDPVINGVSADSRRVSPQNLFVCVPSESRDTHQFLAEIAKAGASAAIVHSPSGLRYAHRLGLSALYIPATGSHFNSALSRVCSLVLGDPTQSMKVVGITGTNGKTTTAWILRQALANLHGRADYLGTLGYYGSHGLEEGANTTPFPVDLWSTIARSRTEGSNHLVMEVSSHALAERRVSGVLFDVGVFLNLSRDHLDFHGTMGAYADSKKLLFTECAASSAKPFCGVINREDPVGAQWLGELPCRVQSFGELGADIFIVATEIRASRIRFSWQIEDASGEFEVPLGGEFNAQNCAAAFATLVTLGHDPSEATQALGSVTSAPGRFESVSNPKGIDVIVDYAHTPDALRQLLAAARRVCRGKLICVFGCGGDRDPGKRPLMAAAVAENCDLAIVTSDNPRTEDPNRIISDVVKGIPAGVAYEVVPDRRMAITRAIESAHRGDSVVIAGKGHEDYQIIGRTKHPFDDRKVAREVLG